MFPARHLTILLQPIAVLLAQDPPPNIVLILADDLGWTDGGCLGSDLYRTPHLDRLANAGVRCTQAYAACTVCSPSRAALLTGQYPARLHVTDWIPGCGSAGKPLQEPAWTKALPAGVPTLPERLRAAGYHTAILGKWHLGGGASAPDQRGFAVALGAGEMGAPSTYFPPYHLPHLEEGPEGEYLTQRLGAEAVRFIEAQEHATRPFFLYLSHYAVHLPIQAPAAAVAACAERVTPQLRHRNATYGAMVEELDRSVGAVLAALERTQLDRSTVVVFTSDNGGVLEHYREPPATGMFPITSNAPARGGKGMLWDGGVRVPLIVRWPGHLPAGRVESTPTISMDVHATLLAAAGLSPLPHVAADGENLLPLWHGHGAPARDALSRDALSRDALYWHYPHYHSYGATPASIIRHGPWRLIETFEDHRAALYDLDHDPGETTDVAAQHPAVVADLRQRLALWRTSVGAQLPSP